MLSLNELRNNATLPEEEWQVIRDRIVTQVRERLVGRELMDILQVAATTQEYAYDRIKTEFASAQVIAKGADFPRDTYDTERPKVSILKIGDGFTIPREDYLSAQFQTQSIEQMIRRIAEKEDDVIFNGDAAFLPDGGAVDFAGNTRADGITGGWPGASGTPNAIYDEVRQTVALLEADKFTGPFTMVVHPDRMSDLRKFDTTSQRTALELVVGEPGIVEKLLVSYAIAAGTVLIMQTGPDVAQLVLAEDLTVENPVYELQQQRFAGNVYERMVPVFYQYGTAAGKSDAIATLTSTDA